MKTDRTEQYANRTDTCFLTAVLEYGNDGFYEERFVLACETAEGEMNDLTFEDLCKLETVLHDFIMKRKGGEQ